MRRQCPLFRQTSCGLFFKGTDAHTRELFDGFQNRFLSSSLFNRSTASWKRGYSIQTARTPKRGNELASSLSSAVLDRVNFMKEQYNNLHRTLADLPHSAMGAAHKELASLRPVATLAHLLEEKLEEAKELQRVMDSPEEKEFHAEAKKDLEECKEEISKIEAEMLQEILPKDSADSNDVYLELRMGAGGVEAQIFAMDIFQMYKNYAHNKGWYVEIIDMHEGGDSRGLREATLNVKGKGVFGRLKYESGVHRVQRVPQTESLGRTHTSTMTVAVLPIPEEADVNIRPSDLRIDTYRSSGAGGQHVNKTESAVRVTHIPTGTVVTMQDARSQHQNKDKALQLLKARLFEMERARLHAIRDTQRKELIGTGERHERIRTYNYPQGRITDHRVPISVYGIDSMMEGELLDEIIEALIMKEQEDFIKSLETS